MGRQANISTPAELISKTAFDSGIRTSTNKQSFSYFLPAFINRKHAEENEEWRNALLSTLAQIGSEVYNIPRSLWLAVTLYIYFV